MNAKIMIALVAFTAVFAGCLVMADVSDAEGSDSTAATATIIYQDDTGKNILIVPFETDANGKVYTVLTWADMGTAAPEGKEFTKWMEVTIKTETPEEESPEPTTPVTEEIRTPANDNYLLEAGDTLTLRAAFDFETFTVTFMDGDKVYATSEVRVGEKTSEDGQKTLVWPTIAGAVGAAKSDTPGFKFVEKYDLNADKTAQYMGLDVDEKTEVKADITVNLVWTPIYKVTWMVGDYVVATGSTEYVNVGTNTEKDFEMAVLAQPENPVKGNYDFKGWMTNGAIVETDKDGKVVYEFTADTVFTAQFTPSSLSVTFMDGEKVVLKVTVLYGDRISADKIPVGYDWDFDFSNPITEDTVIGLKAVEPVPEPEPASEPDNTTTYVLVALFGVLIMAGLVLGIRQLKK